MNNLKLQQKVLSKFFKFLLKLKKPVTAARGARETKRAEKKDASGVRWNDL
jgi:hypothetical protein